MHWQPKTIGVIITACVCLGYFNVLFCEKNHTGGIQHHPRRQVRELTLTFNSPPAVTNSQQPTLKTEENPTAQAVEQISEPLKNHHELTPSTAAIKQAQTPTRIATTKVKKLTRAKKPTEQLTKQLTKQQKKSASTSTSTKPSEKMPPHAPAPDASKTASEQQSSAKSSAKNSAKNIHVGRSGAQQAKAASVMEKYMAQVRDFISQQKRYPRAAKIRKQQGEVTISFVIFADGHVDNAKIVQHCQSRHLNKSTKILLSTLRFEAAPPAIKHQFPKTVLLAVKYQFG